MVTGFILHEASLLHGNTFVRGDTFARQHFCIKYDPCKVHTNNQNKQNRKIIDVLYVGAYLFKCVLCTKVTLHAKKSQCTSDPTCKSVPWSKVTPNHLIYLVTYIFIYSIGRQQYKNIKTHISFSYQNSFNKLNTYHESSHWFFRNFQVFWNPPRVFVVQAFLVTSVNNNSKLLRISRL